jgi:hypothetical protein
VCIFILPDNSPNRPWTARTPRARCADDIPRLDELRLDRRVLGFTLAAALFTTLLTGLTHALQSTQPRLTGRGCLCKRGGLLSCLIVGEEQTVA